MQRRTAIVHLREQANGTSTEYGYDGASRLSDLKLMTGTTITNEYAFTYTPADQIKQSERSNNAFAWTGAFNVNRNYTADGQNKYNGIAGIVPSYDPKGNLTSAGGATYSYGAENDLATQGAYRLYYDPMHRLIYSTQTAVRLEYDGDNLATELDSAGTVLRRYVFGPGADEPLVWYEGSGNNNKRWLAADAQGSIVSVTDASGTTLAINSYDEYGIPASTSEPNAGRFRYTGQQWVPELGMSYYKARIYSPSLGRFLQTDPVGYEDQMNLYAYVANDPINRVDASGETGEEIVVNGCASCHRPVLPRATFESLKLPSMEVIRDAVRTSLRTSILVSLKTYSCLTSGSCSLSTADANINDPDSLEGKTAEEVEEAAKEAGFTEARPTNSLGGKALTKPGNKADQIRIMPGAPNRSQEIKRGPYVETSISGRRATVPLAGNPVLR